MTIHTFQDICNVWYINLTHREDRKKHVESQLASIGIHQCTRFSAIRTENGAIGCSLSHLEILKKTDALRLDHVMIVEDDILFINPETVSTQLTQFFSNMSTWDVVLLGGNNVGPYTSCTRTPCIQVNQCQTTTGYIVNGHYIRTLMQNIKMGVTHLLHNPSNHVMYAIDRFWFILQQKGLWYMCVPPIAIQQEGYSDIEKKHTNYKRAMLCIDK